eukprot:TRINITY_DN30495_c0_g1_i3.p2 TRINITY_DN30495_c0_g1~~TRINITY_DN30495_c0_g1_i3.p2  ORF type:complete len:106 (-),score=24.27 TRINITY_DN30495_c0_g1_i3:48-365(-)
MIRRQPRSTQGVSSAASDVYKRQTQSTWVAFRGHLRTLIKDLERKDSQTIQNIIHSGSKLIVREKVKKSKKMICTKCGFASSHSLCKACKILEMLKKGKPQIELS